MSRVTQVLYGAAFMAHLNRIAIFRHIYVHGNDEKTIKLISLITDINLVKAVEIIVEMIATVNDRVRHYDAGLLQNRSLR